MTALPRVLAEIAEIAGEDAALAVARERGGTQVYLPPEPKPDHWLSELLGHDVAGKIAAQLTGGFPMRVEIPLGPTSHAARTRAIVDRMISEGRSETEIAKASGYNARSIRRRRAIMRDALSAVSVGQIGSEARPHV
ncbi:hypothetical protein [Sphingomonas oryzagri]